MNKKHLYYLITFIFILILFDQITKFYVKTHFLLGEEVKVFGTWFKIHFIENDGMAYGLKFSEGRWAKIFLTLFRIGAIAYGIYYFIKIILPRKNIFLNYIIALIIAGAIGNLIDSLFYGLIFTNSPNILDYMASTATLSYKNGYGHFLEGKVVDMLYFPMINTTLPTWIPIYGGERFEFFSPVFNIADSCISCGVFVLLIFNKKFFKDWNSKHPKPVA